MPVVKKKKGGKKKSKSATGSKPSSANGKKTGKKKSKKSKISTEDKLLLKLEKGAELLRANIYQYEHYVEVADAWLLKNASKIITILTQLDTGSDEVVGYDEVKSVLFDLQFPMSEVELHQTCKLLDYENTGDIVYKDLTKGLRWHMKQALLRDDEDDGGDDGSEDEDVEVPADFTLVRGQSAKNVDKCLHCKIGLWTPQTPDIKYIDLTVMLITFADSMRRHPCHFTKVVHTRMTVYGLIQLIRAEVGIQSTTITVFRDKTRSPESQLDEGMTLEDCGYDGRDWFNPIEHVIFYDYASEFNECPILMCDHYFQDMLKLS